MKELSRVALPEMMSAAVYRGVNKIVVESVPVPRIGANELLVKVAACGVCPTDIKKIQYGTVPPPRIFGHETSGTIVQVGARVRGFRVGERVGLHHHVPCLKCHACRHRAFAQCAHYKRTGITAGFEPAGGGFAEYVRVMNFVLPGAVKIPARNSMFEGAMLEPVNTVLKAVKMLSPQKGDHVLVAGQGPIGLMFTRLLRHAGAKVIATDLIEKRLALARHFGARLTLNPLSPGFEKTVRRETRGTGLDAAVIAVPSHAVVRQAQNLLRGGGQILLFAHTKRGDETPVDLSTVCVDEKQLLGSYSADFTLQKEVAELVFSRKLDVRKLITHTFPLRQTAEAISLAAQASADALKVVVTPDETTK
ncbi:MAG TPA: alcohol dehydrogenase catalytic domain-containing protein [Verrucomicrobiae bacterium]|jgi:L-iditol 2-dehydrogenase|nr:alcohol dehydrogenase catalytic domain-containing protein [Verrucomicrobiae bacterium]